jgi:hypothetical protein
MKMLYIKRLGHFSFVFCFRVAGQNSIAASEASDHSTANSNATDNSFASSTASDHRVCLSDPSGFDYLAAYKHLNKF